MSRALVRTALLVAAVAASLAVPSLASASSATLTSPPDGATYYTGNSYPWQVQVPTSASFNRDSSCAATKVGGIQRSTDQPPSGNFASEGGTSGGTFTRTVSLGAGDYQFRAWLDCGEGSSYTYSGVRTIHVKSGNPPSPPNVCPAQAGGCGGSTVTIPIPILQVAKEQLTTPCDFPENASNGDLGSYVEDCNKAHQLGSQVASTGPPMICAVQIIFSTGYILPALHVLQGAECIEKYGPAHKDAHVRAGAARKRATGGQARAGAYRGFTTPLGSPGRLPTRKQLVRAAAGLGKSLLRGRRPRSAQRISFKVARNRRSATFQTRLVLRCSDRRKVRVSLKHMPLSLRRKRSFKVTADRRFISLHISGRFLQGPRRLRRRHAVTGVFYLAANLKHHGACSSLVAFAARRR